MQVAATYNTVHNKRGTGKIDLNSKMLKEQEDKSLRDRNDKLQKTICAQLRRLVMSGDNNHVVLEERHPQQLEVIENIGVLCRIRLKDKAPPCIITFKKTSSLYGFNCYYSEYLREPDESKNHGSETNPTRIVVTGVREGRSGAKRTQVFNKDWLYLNMQSEHGCTVTINVSFKTELAPLRAKNNNT
mmetsp:Transcript_17791/g.22403  ORF Transcript_17791/g.22403 Transcript_17791/m.22403 type:complete len:187 (-) Transcript_17791:1160-1720(-)